MSKAVRRKRQAVRLLQQAVRQFATASRKGSHQPDADSDVAMFERYSKRLKEMADGGSTDVVFWSLHHKVYLRLLKTTLKLRD